MNKKYCSCDCGRVLTNERISALQFLGVPENQWRAVECSDVKLIRGIYSGESGTSEILFCSEVGNVDGVSSIFQEAEQELHKELIKNV